MTSRYLDNQIQKEFEKKKLVAVVEKKARQSKKKMEALFIHQV